MTTHSIDPKARGPLASDLPKGAPPGSANAAPVTSAGISSAAAPSDPSNKFSLNSILTSTSGEIADTANPKSSESGRNTHDSVSTPGASAGPMSSRPGISGPGSSAIVEATGVNIANEHETGRLSLSDAGDVDEDEASRSNPRAKLSARDIKLILYLIVAVKPFKYIGDRNLLQTRKWEIIQTNFSQIRQSNFPGSPLFIPTVRTLQRQLLGAIKKARHRHKNFSLHGLDNPVLKTVNADSPLEELELATLELFELSETLKNGRIANSALLEYSMSSAVDITPAPTPSGMMLLRLLVLHLLVAQRSSTSLQSQIHPSFYAAQHPAGAISGLSGVSVGGGVGVSPRTGAAGTAIPNATTSFSHNPAGATISGGGLPAINPTTTARPDSSDTFATVTAARAALSMFLQNGGAESGATIKTEGDIGSRAVELATALVRLADHFQAENQDRLADIIDQHSKFVNEQQSLNKRLLSEVVTFLRTHPAITSDVLKAVSDLM